MEAVIEKNDQEKLKTMLKISEIVNHMKSKNIKFNYMNENDVKRYLTENNNYYNVSIYRNNFQKYPNGELKGKYLDLDFAYLKDLAIIDLRLRVIIFKMTTDIEHYLKMHILKLTENLEDGYRIVNMYLDYDYSNEDQNQRVHRSILKKVGSDYYDEIFSKYGISSETDKISNIPIWEFLEIITFGELISFYTFFANEYELEEEKKNIFILREVSKLRNAVAHNSCILCSLNESTNQYTVDYKVTSFLKSCGINFKNREKKMSNSRIRQIVYTLYMFNEIVTSDGIKKNISEELNKFMNERIIHHKEYYNNNDLLISIYHFFLTIVSKKYI